MQSAISKKKVFLFKTLLVLLPVIIIIGLEALLRLFSYGDDLRLFVTLEKNPGYWITNPQIGKRYFRSQAFLPATSYDAFRKQKPVNAYRVFVMGASTAAGFPYFNNGSFPRMLQTRLQAQHPDKSIEMVNLALPAVSSYTLLDLADELVAYQPDAVLIYAGHNEFYGALGSGSTESIAGARWTKTSFLRIQHFKIAQLLRDAIFAVTSSRMSLAGSERNTLMARLAGQQQIGYRSALFETTLESFQENLAAIVQIFRSRRTPVVLSELVSNLGDQPPFISQFRDSTAREHWQTVFARGTQLARADSGEQALAVFEQLAKVDDLPAILHFEMAKCLTRLRRFDEAKVEFLAAKDLDALRFRASEDFNRVIRETGAQFQIPVVPMLAVFGQQSPDGIIGDNLILEHLHPNLRGYFLMAKAFAETLEANSLISPDPATHLTLPDSIFWQRRAITTLDEEVARLRIETLVSNWPFRVDITQVKTPDYVPRDRLQQIVYSEWREEISWDLAHTQLAEYYAKNKQPEKAVAEYEALVLGVPYVVTPYLRLGLTYLALNRPSDAYAIFEKSLTVEPTALAQKWLGSICLQQNNLTTGLEYLQRALQQEPTDPETLYNISVGFAKAGDFARAKEFAEQLVRSFPAYPGAQQHLQRLRAIK